MNIYREREQNARTCEKPCFMRFPCVFVRFCGLPFSAFFAHLFRKFAPRLPLRCPCGASAVQCPTDPERKKRRPRCLEYSKQRNRPQGVSLRPGCDGRGEGFIVGPRGTLPISSRAGLMLRHKITVLWG